MRIFMLLFLWTTFVYAQPGDFEQKGFNYLVEEIIQVKYPKESYLFFSGQSEKYKSINGPFSQCFDSDKNFEHFFYLSKEVNSNRIPIELNHLSNINRSKKIKSNKLNAVIYRAVVDGNSAYVYIKVFKLKHFTDHYLIKLSTISGEIIDYCEVNEVI